MDLLIRTCGFSIIYFTHGTVGFGLKCPRKVIWNFGKAFGAVLHHICNIPLTK